MQIGDKVECKIHGGYFWFPLVAYDESTDSGTVELDSGQTRELPLVAQSVRQGYENCILVKDPPR